MAADQIRRGALAAATAASLLLATAASSTQETDRLPSDPAAAMAAAAARLAAPDVEARRGALAVAAERLRRCVEDQACVGDRARSEALEQAARRLLSAGAAMVSPAATGTLRTAVALLARDPTADPALAAARRLQPAALAACDAAVDPSGADRDMQLPHDAAPLEVVLGLRATALTLARSGDPSGGARALLDAVERLDAARWFSPGGLARSAPHPLRPDLAEAALHVDADRLALDAAWYALAGQQTPLLREAFSRWLDRVARLPRPVEPVAYRVAALAVAASAAGAGDIAAWMLETAEQALATHPAVQREPLRIAQAAVLWDRGDAAAAATALLALRERGERGVTHLLTHQQAADRDAAWEAGGSGRPAELDLAGIPTPPRPDYLTTLARFAEAGGERLRDRVLHHRLHAALFLQMQVQAPPTLAYLANLSTAQADMPDSLRGLMAEYRRAVERDERLAAETRTRAPALAPGLWALHGKGPAALASPLVPPCLNAGLAALHAGGGTTTAADQSRAMSRRLVALSERMRAQSKLHQQVLAAQTVGPASILWSRDIIDLRSAQVALGGVELLVKVQVTGPDLIVFATDVWQSSLRLLPGAAADVMARAARLRGEMEAPSGGSEWLEDAHAVWAEVFEPALLPLRRIQAGKLRIVLGPGLEHLPVNALLLGPAPQGAPLASLAWLDTEYEVAVLPGALSLLQPPVRGQATRGVVAVGAPRLHGEPPDCAEPRKGTPGLGGQADPEAVRALCRLPQAQEMLVRVARRLTERTLLPGATLARLEAARSAVQQASLIMVATHSLSASEVERLGGAAEPALVLTPAPQGEPGADGLWRASSIAALSLSAEAVVLAACASGGRLPPDGRVMRGLTDAFLTAGARRVVVSGWPVDEDATAILMSRALQQPQAFLDAPAAELRAAMQWVRAPNAVPGTDYAHPRFWAAFTVFGPR